ncbi:hypothetical protein DY000_02012516 [Brassica cretica]|uniref:Uncharacterized protein n=1 Tax=Brassica cretica TaxID=69181 RepID=A0ABQ7CQ78_BRACR|nr:hypothetical protein DY000_02012516 [Brassica cretica]
MSCVSIDSSSPIWTDSPSRWIADSLDSLAVVHVRDLTVAGVEGGMSEVQRKRPSFSLAKQSDPEGQDPIAKEDGDGTVPNPDGVISEGEASLAEDD